MRSPSDKGLWSNPVSAESLATVALSSDLAGKLADLASRKRVPQALIVETALASFLSPDNSERMEAALGRRRALLPPRINFIIRSTITAFASAANNIKGLNIRCAPRVTRRMVRNCSEARQLERQTKRFTRYARRVESG